MGDRGWRNGDYLPLKTENSTSTAVVMETKPSREYYPPLSVKKGVYNFVQSGEFQPPRPPPRKGGSLVTPTPPFPRRKGRDGSVERGEEEERKSVCKRLSGSALCKVTVIGYLLGCVLVSALYVALYGGPSQKMFAASDAWIPGKPTAPPKHSGHSSPPPSLPPLRFIDAPYTEWISQRWTHSHENFSNWPSLPPSVDAIQQVAAGSLSGEQGVWLLTNSTLFFALNLDGADPNSVQFVDIGEDLELDVVGGSRVAVDVEETVFVATPFNVTLLDCSQEPKFTCSLIAALSEDYPVEWNEVTAAVVSVSDGQLWLGTDSGLYILERNEETLLVGNVSTVSDPVTTLAWRSTVSSTDGSKRKAFIFDPHSSSSSSSSLDDRYLAVSGSDGLHNFGKPAHREFSSSSSSSSLSQKSLFGLLVVGTRERVHFLDGERWWFEWVSLWYSGQGGLVDGIPTSLTFSSTGELFIGNNVSLTRVNINYTFDRLGPEQGLPFNQILSLHHSSFSPQLPPTLSRQAPKFDFTNLAGGTLWVGTTRGFALYDISAGEFRHYFYGNRWHPGDRILGFASSGSNNSTVVLTDRGMAVVYPQLWTLEEKAKHYQTMLDRHTRPPGLVADCDLTDYIPSTCTPHTTDNDGLWTSIALAAEAFRYQVTGDGEARKNAWDLFLGMQFLNNVTGIKGLMARSVVSENVSVSGGTWHNSTTEPGWKWKGDTSSDEVVGHMFAYPLIHELVADTAEERAQARELVDNIVGYIHNNSYYLIDVTNESTRWGVWNPQPLNFNQSWSDEHGINSLQILTYLLSAYRLTGREEYSQAWANLSDDNGVYEGVPTHYGLNMVNQKITFPRDDNYSDDELAFLPYFTYFFTILNMNQRVWSMLEQEMKDYITLSIQRAWRIVEREKSALWTAIYAYAMDLANDPDLIEMLVWNLRTWPLELVEWNTTNSHRLDITFNPEQDRNLRSDTQSERVLPANERTQLRWNGNPFLLDSGGGDSEMDPGAWLLPYWMARWTKML